MKNLRICALIALVLSTGCATNELQESSAMPSALTKTDLHQLLLNHTFPFSKGGIFFASESAATVNWEGNNEDITWYATDDSEFCYTAALFGGKEECLGLKRTESGDYLREWEGTTKEVKASDIKSGRAF